jgi:hypothetical protein
MENRAFTEKVKRLKQVNGIIRTLDPAIRGHAFSILLAFITEQDPAVLSGTGKKKTGMHKDTLDPGGTHGHEALLKKFSSEDKPADNVLVIAAFLYGKYGTEPFTVKEVRDLAEGITIPARIDMTLNQTKRSGKALFKSLGGGKFRFTVPGEVFLKKTYGVKKGREKRPAPEK